MPSRPLARTRTDVVSLPPRGWNPVTRRALEKLIRRGSGKNLPAVFDFDNTLVCGDVGEATFAVLVRDGLLTPEKLAPTLSPPLRLRSGKRLTPASGADLTEYYEALLDPTVHGDADPTPLATGYAWVVEAMAGLSIAEVVRATRIACELACPGDVRSIDVTPGRTAYPAPWFYPEMVDLLAALIRHQFDVRIISASNAWSVRWMVQHRLNPMLRERGVPDGLRPEQITGITTLLADRAGHLYKDPLLLRENPGYAALDAKVLRGLKLTSRLHFPVPTYSGKITCIHDTIGRRPVLCAGDSPGDLPMLAYCENRLWIARADKSTSLRKLAETMRATGDRGWLVQPVRTRDQPGFLVNAPAGVR